MIDESSSHCQTHIGRFWGCFLVWWGVYLLRTTRTALRG